MGAGACGAGAITTVARQRAGPRPAPIFYPDGMGPGFWDMRQTDESVSIAILALLMVVQTGVMHAPVGMKR